MKEILSTYEQFAYSINQIAKLASVSRGTVFNQIRIGNLKVFHCGKRTLATKAQIEEWIKKLSNSI